MYNYKYNLLVTQELNVYDMTLKEMLIWVGIRMDINVNNTKKTSSIKFLCVLNVFIYLAGPNYMYIRHQCDTVRHEAHA